MPLFDLKCTVCEKEEDNVILGSVEAIPACNCGGPREKVWKTVKVQTFGEVVFEHLGLEPVTVHSKRQLKEECQKRGMYSEYAWD